MDKIEISARHQLAMQIANDHLTVNGNMRLALLYGDLHTPREIELDPNRERLEVETDVSDEILTAAIEVGIIQQSDVDEAVKAARIVFENDWLHRWGVKHGWQFSTNTVTRDRTNNVTKTACAVWFEDSDGDTQSQCGNTLFEAAIELCQICDFEDAYADAEQIGLVSCEAPAHD